jgi:hypothetical protein
LEGTEMPIKMKVCNTAEYNQSLKKRGRIFHLFDEAVEVWSSREARRKEKSKFIYSDELIKILAAFRYVLKYPFRQLQGLLEDYIAHHHLKLPVPDYSTLCRRMSKLLLTIHDHRDAKQVKEGDVVDVVIDATGINIYHTGGGHSKENGKCRLYRHLNQVRKMHVCMDPKSKDVLAMQMSKGSTSDAEVAPILLSGIPYRLGVVYADGAYDRASVRQACHERLAKQLIPPARTAVKRKAKKNEDTYLWHERNEAIREIYTHGEYDAGLKTWKQTHGYGKRSIIEAYFSRFKATFGFHFMSRCEPSRQNELAIKVNILNSYNRYGAAIFKKVA